MEEESGLFADASLLLEEKVYKTSVTSVEDLRERIFAAGREIKEAGHAQRIKQSFIIRCRACIRARGGHFEHLL
ncbi:unnamed protein product [Euphydryas editha]|uniref:Uncharacterized protein n=1 Tax=Euphydryas editha TaxID=104508 RepID=A0AAU9URB7_EUPED|nr:unnamed protein product [Euphydryas editha]